MRWFEWYMSPAEDWRKTYWDRFAADYARISRNRAFYMTLADDKQMNRTVQPLYVPKPRLRLDIRGQASSGNSH